jgi:hypothetical protein
MNVAGRIAVTAGSLGVGALALQQLNGHIHPGLDDRTTHARTETDKARAEWDAWKGGVTKQFPGLKLDTPSDHQAFDGYLAQHPAPEWITVSHDQYNHVHLDAKSPLSRSVERPPGETTGYPMVFGGLVAVAGAATAVMSLIPGMRPASTAGFMGMALGGAAAVVGGGALAIFSARGDANLTTVYGAADALTDEVDKAGGSA